MTYPAGSFVVSMAQPKMGLIRYLLGRTFYPDNEWTRDRDGSPIRPYDMATDTMFEFMGVRVDPVDDIAECTRRAAKGRRARSTPAGKVTRGPNGYSLDGRLNDSFRAVNLLFDKGIAVRRVDKPSAGLRPGDFLVPRRLRGDAGSSRQPDRRRFHAAARRGFRGRARHEAPARRDVPALRRRQHR